MILFYLTALALAVPPVLSKSSSSQLHPAAISASGTTPPFDSTADTDFDIIRTSDPSSFACLAYIGRREKQIWDKRADGEPIVKTYSFMARFTDGTSIEIAANSEFNSQATAHAEAMRYTAALGQLPFLLRNGIRRFSIHDGDESFHAGAGQIVVYAHAARQREAYRHLEEPLFHEAVHAALDDQYRLTPAWVAAQRADGGFLTEYAASSPDREDLAETALFAYALQRYPDRMPPAAMDAIRKAVLRRLILLQQILDVADQRPDIDALDCKP